VRPSYLSVLPASSKTLLDRYEHEQGNTKAQLTRSILFDLLRRDRKDTQYFGHYLYHCVFHRRRWWDLSMNLKPSEEVFDLCQDFDERALVII
jgi:hypothetical protein